jgi:hypothetical protein
MRAWRFGCLLVGLFGCVLMGVAQELPMKKGATEVGVWGGGGTGLGHETSFQFANAGMRMGRVLTAQHGAGFLRGNFEYVVDFSPLYLIFQDRTPVSRQTVYGGAISPFIVKWNFTSGKRLVPFVAAEGTAILTTKDVPAGDTSIINFGSGIASGLQIVRGDHHAVTFSGHLLHISNASIGNHNPSINIGLQFRMGYQWWR